MKPLIQARLNKLVMTVAFVVLEVFVKAVNAAFLDARKLVDISAWSYFSRIEKKGLATVTCSIMCSSLDAALNGWCGICTREEIEDVTPLEHMESKRAAGFGFRGDGAVLFLETPCLFQDTSQPQDD